MIDIDRKFQVDASDLRQMLQLAGEKATDQEVMKTNQIWTQNRRSTPGASGSIMETLPTGRCASENMSRCVIRKVIPLHTDRL